MELRLSNDRFLFFGFVLSPYLILVLVLYCIINAFFCLSTSKTFFRVRRCAVKCLHLFAETIDRQ